MAGEGDRGALASQPNPPNLRPGIADKLGDGGVLADQRKLRVVAVIRKIDHFGGDEIEAPFRIFRVVAQDLADHLLGRFQLVGMLRRMPFAGRRFREGIQDAPSDHRVRAFRQIGQARDGNARLLF